MGGFLEVSFARRLKTPEGIARRVPGVWVLSLPMHFNCCPFFLKALNCRSPYWDQLIFISKKGGSSFATIWTRSSFSGVGGFAPSVQISAVNFRCWFPAAKFTVCWNFSSQSFISLVLFHGYLLLLFLLNGVRVTELFLFFSCVTTIFYSCCSRTMFASRSSYSVCFLTFSTPWASSSCNLRVLASIRYSLIVVLALCLRHDNIILCYYWSLTHCRRLLILLLASAHDVHVTKFFSCIPFDVRRFVSVFSL